MDVKLGKIFHYEYRSLNGSKKINWTRVSIAVACLGTVLFGIMYSFLHTGTASSTSVHNPIASYYAPKVDAHGFLPLEEATQLCLPLHLEPYPNRDRKRKVYDLTIVNTELDWIEIRMGELEDVVDYFVIAEANITYSDHPKPFYILENWDRFSRWHHKIIHHKIDGKDNYTDTWDREAHQRTAMFTQVFPGLTGDQAPEKDDILMVSDVDEVPRADAVKTMRNCFTPQHMTLQSRFYYYSYQWRYEKNWDHPQATLFKTMDTTTLPHALRFEKGSTWILPDAAWHCSYCLSTLGAIVNKFQSFSHQEFNTPEYKDRQRILHLTRTGKSFFGGAGGFLDRVSTEGNVPTYLAKSKANMERFAYLVDRDPVSGNFQDYVPEDSADPSKWDFVDTIEHSHRLMSLW